ncbi:MAG TPA: proline racemase family protein, partial [Planctomycetota bacterium]|nr:proline racemase family protein [Planctomycetota bacterium]
FRREHDAFRSAVVNEPRGSDVLVGALLCEPADRTCRAGVIFFNNVGTIGMCGHGTIGLMVTLAHLGRIKPGDHRIETSVGVVTATLLGPNDVRIANVPSYRHAKGVEVAVDGARVKGDVAWGGNWFFLVDAPGQDLTVKNAARMTEHAWKIRRALVKAGVTGTGGEEIDHIELFAPSLAKGVDSRNFVLCPGGAYDRSPCGTGTSAKAACLFEDGKLKEGQVWRQESIVGSVFEATVTVKDGKIIPSIRGSAYVTGQGRLLLDPGDPFVEGIRG